MKIQHFMVNKARPYSRKIYQKMFHINIIAIIITSLSGGGIKKLCKIHLNLKEIINNTMPYVCVYINIQRYTTAL